MKTSPMTAPVRSSSSGDGMSSAAQDIAAKARDARTGIRGCIDLQQ